MADNVIVTPGTGNTVAADEVVDGVLGTVKVQFVKLMDGTLDGTSKAAVGANGLAVDVKSLPTLNIVNVSGTVSLPSGASTAAKQPALGTAGAASADVLTVQGITSMTPLKTDGSGVTQPVSGTFWQATQPVSGTFWQATQPVSGTFWQATQPVSGTVSAAQSGTWNITNVSGTVSLPTGASTSAKQPALGTAGTASADVITIQGITSMTKLLVTPDSVALPANQSVNVNQLAGTTTDTNSGTKSAGTLRVVLATDQPALTNKLLVTPDSVALPANQSVNVSQINGVTTLMGNGVTGTGSQRVTIASDNTAFSVNATCSGNVASAATDSGNPVKVGGKYNLAAITLTDGQRGDAQLDANGYLKVNIAAGAAAGGTSSNIGSAFPTPATAAGFNDGTNMQGAKVYDLDSGAGTDYVQGVGIRFAASGGSTAADTNSGTKSAATLRVVLATDQPALTNKLLVTPDSVALPANQSVNVSQINGVTTLMGNGTTGTGSQRVTIASDNTAFNIIAAGDVASGSADSGNPVKIGILGKTALPTAVTDAQRVNALGDKFGRQVVVLNTVRDLEGHQQTTITSSVSETTIVTAGAAGVFNDLLGIEITNSSATALIVTLKDSTGGTTQAIWALAANGGICKTFNTPMNQGTAANNWTLTCGGSVASIYVNVQFAKNK